MSISTQLTSPLNFLGVWIVLGHRCTEFVADVQGFVGGEDHRLGLIHAAFAGLLATDVQCDSAALGETAAVVLELHPDVVFPAGIFVETIFCSGGMPRKL